MLLTRIREVLNSNLGRDTEYSYWGYRGFLPGFTSNRPQESKTSVESYDLRGYYVIRLSISLPAFRRRMMHSSLRWKIKPYVENCGSGMEKRGWGLGPDRNSSHLSKTFSTQKLIFSRSVILQLRIF
jgi:hypothetical protein